MNNKLILCCLFATSLSFASKPLPAAGAGAGLPALAAAQAGTEGAEQSTLHAVSKQSQETADKHRKALAQLVAEMHRACGPESSEQSEKEFKKVQDDLLSKKYKNEKFKIHLSWRAKPTANNKWIDQLKIALKDSDKFLSLTTHYSLVASSPQAILLDKPDPSKSLFIVADRTLIDQNAQSIEEIVLLFVRLINFKNDCMLNILASHSEMGVLRSIINNQASAFSSSL